MSVRNVLNTIFSKFTDIFPILVTDLHQELAITRRQPELGTPPEVCNGGNTIPTKSFNKSK